MKSKIKKENRKAYTISLHKELVYRLQCLKKLAKGDVDIGYELYIPILKKIEDLEKKAKITKDCWRHTKKCPSCDSYLVKRKGKDNYFLGCFNFPACKHTEQMINNKNKKDE